MAMRKAATLRCSFCGKSQNDVKKLIAGPAAVYICHECVVICVEIINDDAQREAAAATATEEGRGKKKVKKKAPKKGAASTAKKQARQPRKTKYIAPGIL